MLNYFYVKLNAQWYLIEQTNRILRILENVQKTQSNLHVLQMTYVLQPNDLWILYISQAPDLLILSV